MQIFDYLIRASNAASLFQSEKEDLHDIAVVSNSYCKEFINSILISFSFRARAIVALPIPKHKGFQGLIVIMC